MNNETKNYTPEQWMAIGANRYQFLSWNYTQEAYILKDLFGNEKRVIAPRFIMEVDWNCSLEHMLGKWEDACASNNPDAYMPKFYANLSSDNRARLLAWIMKNYTGEQKLSL